MSEVIHVDFGGDGSVTERYLTWPQSMERYELIEQTKVITAAIYFAEGTVGEKFLGRLKARQQECMKRIQPLTKQLIDEIYDDSIKMASQLKTEAK